MPTRYFLGLTLPSDLASLINHWRQNYHQYGLKTVEPHITIIAPFYLSSREEDLTKKLTQYVKTIKKFELTVHNFDFFHYHTYTAFANVLSSEELNQLHQTLTKLITPYIDHRPIPDHHTPFRPHITLGHRLSPAAFQELWPQLQQNSLHQTIPVTHLVLFRKDPDQPYHPTHQLALDN